MRKISYILATAASLILVSCGSPKTVPYFQDIENESVTAVANENTIRIAPKDKLSIIVNSRDQQLTNLFNLPYVSRMVGAPTDTYSSYSQGISSYTVDPEGMIDFPVLGYIKVAGLSRTEIAKYIKNELMSRNLVKDPVVTVEFVNLHVSIMGEVARPGRLSIDHDNYTVLDAISAAGDLTIFGRRENVKVLRDENGSRKTYVINLDSASDVLNSPVYYLQQNDIIYVEPNEVRARQSTVNGNNVLSTSFWISIASLSMTLMTYLAQMGAFK